MTVSNRSLERGLAVLECFRPGVGLLTHREVAERTGLPKATVTRLLGTLAGSGYLVFDESRRGYHLGLPVLSLSRCMALGSELRREMAPRIRAAARATSAIIGFGAAHDTDIVYLEAANGDPQRPDRQVGAGMRAPIATTSVGLGYLAGLPAGQRETLLAQLVCGHGPALRDSVDGAVAEVRRRGFCMVLYADGEQAAIGAPVRIQGAPLHAIGVGYRVPYGTSAREVPAAILDALQDLAGHASRLRREAAGTA